MGKDIVLKFDLPGFDKKDVKVMLKRDRALIEAEKKIEKKIKKKDYYHEEKSYRSFSYSTSLPEIDVEKAKTEFKNGVLKIFAPRKKKREVDLQ
ncbi:MAG: Hsp20/alpha crystallin family protein [Candidatus Pacearchaeota archaeon]|nr:Hsp20/alpha crystallin family protein [Candidatus Pacearchaeota archaeon]